MTYINGFRKRDSSKKPVPRDSFPPNLGGYPGFPIPGPAAKGSPIIEGPNLDSPGDAAEPISYHLPESINVPTPTGTVNSAVATMSALPSVVMPTGTNALSSPSVAPLPVEQTSAMSETMPSLGPMSTLSGFTSTLNSPPSSLQTIPSPSSPSSPSPVSSLSSLSSLSSPTSPPQTTAAPAAPGTTQASTITGASQTLLAAGASTSTPQVQAQAHSQSSVVVGATVGSIIGAFILFILAFFIIQYKRGAMFKTHRSYLHMQDQTTEPQPFPPRRHSISSATTLGNFMAPSVYARESMLPPSRPETAAVRPDTALRQETALRPASSRIMTDAPRISWMSFSSPAHTMVPSVNDGYLEASRPAPQPSGLGLRLNNNEPEPQTQAPGGWGRLTSWLEDNRRRSRA
ncbi:hypothetical protein BT63DRAFT_123528 [Microthyrium microscopicum]|uniref:Uncharacterized protein n=1 Tax=Microthyrium microscopicum TaxID=703497 RepID=A0A6A6TTW8_9PEZI|nr:hypothetical protein BT63DRAFT_123528 [Microthyrium microscopicum]